MVNRQKTLFASGSGGMIVGLLVGLVLAVALACQKPVPQFPHGPHLKMACGGPNEPGCLSCLSCHAGIAQAETPGGAAAADPATGRAPGHPGGSQCQDCHKNSHRVERVLRGPKSAAAELAASIRFDHQRHLRMPEVKGQCIGCHGGLVADAGGAAFPDMASCFQCHVHQEQWDGGKCAPCHEQSDLKTLFPRTFLRHGPGWDRGHAAAAQNTTVQCAACHSTESCDDCHDVSQGLEVEVRHAARVDRDFVHPADFLTRHALDAAAEPARCLSCHRTETCDGCHLARGVSAGRSGAVSPHPPGWMGPDALAVEHHGRAARRDILACASCHDQGPQTNCIGCHRVGGPGGNPHPEGWRSQRTPSDLMCDYCHEEP